MNDDIVTRLKSIADLDEAIGGTVIPNICSQAAFEIKRLRELVVFHTKQLSDIRATIHNEGPNPEYHRMVMRKHRSEWPALWKALDEAQKDLAQRPYYE